MQLFENTQQTEIEHALKTAKERAFGSASHKDENEPDTLQLAALFNLSFEKIGKYEFQTRDRAYWSFVYAVIAMLAGITLLCWGAFDLFQAAAGGVTATNHIVSGSIISTVGGAMSAYITKTFLDVHRTSLLQLNHYFKQSVLNSHILSAQRLADRLKDDEVKEEMYKALIGQVIALIAAEQAQSGDLDNRAGPRGFGNGRRRARRRAAKQQVDADQ